jgi:hypothetical protein
MSSLTSAFDEWDWLLANPRFARRGSTIAWEGFQRRVLPFNITPDHLVELAEAGQYSFQVADGSIFQVTYQFDPQGELVQFASLGFYRTIEDTISVADQTLSWTTMSLMECRSKRHKLRLFRLHCRKPSLGSD